VHGQEGLGQDGDPSQPAARATADRYDPWGPRQYELNLRSIAEVARHAGAKPVFVTQARLVAASNRESERQRIAYRYVSLTHDALVRAFADCDRAMMAAAAATKTPVLDLAPLVGRDDLFTDHVHTNPKGSEAIADAIAAFVARVLGADGVRAGGA
jgi:lysophospholipase L1-like esterase